MTHYSLLLIIATSIFVVQPLPIVATTDLKILVPFKMGFQEFVNWSSSEVPPTSNSTFHFSGFSIEVFRQCIEKLNYSYTFIGYGDRNQSPNYNDMVQKLVSKEVDGVVADLTITSDRLKLVDFTQPYIQSSLEMIVPLESEPNIHFWILLDPFSWGLWVSIVVMFVLTIISIFIVEYCGRSDGESWKATLSRSFWLTSMAIFFSHREDTKTHLGKAVILFWLVAVLIFTSSYTASLSSIIIAQQQQQQTPTIRSFQDLQNSRLHIGCQEGSFTLDFLKNHSHISPNRLIQLDTDKQYVDALNSNEVASIIDESPYIETFLTSLGCKYTIVDSNIGYFGGFSFAFQKNSSLTDDVSLSIISLEESGDLQELKNKWLGSGQCITTSTTTKMSFYSYVGVLCLIVGFYLACVLLRCLYCRSSSTISHSRQGFQEMTENRNV